MRHYYKREAGNVRPDVCGRLIALSVALLCASTVAALAQPLVQFRFEEDADAVLWRSPTPDASLIITREPADVRDGAGTLEFSYDAAQNGYFIVEADGVEVADGASMSFSVKCSEATPILFGLTEEDGSSYDGYLQCPAHEWLDVEVGLEDLQLRQDSEDENGALDAAEIRSILFFDLSNLPGDVGKALGWKQGAQTMWLDNVSINAHFVPSRSHLDGAAQIVLDDYESDIVFGLAVGGAELSMVPDGAGGGALSLVYSAIAEQWQGCVYGVGHADLTGLEQVVLRARVAQTSRLAVVLEERDGSKYQTFLDLQPAEWQQHVLPAASFQLDPETIDENDALDADELRVMILLVDTLSSVVDAGGVGEVLLDDLAAGFGG
jgi:hypothetical protein